MTRMSESVVALSCRSSQQPRPAAHSLRLPEGVWQALAVHPAFGLFLLENLLGNGEVWGRCVDLDVKP